VGSGGATRAPLDAGIEHMRDQIMPAMLAMDGCIGLSMLTDRTTGRCISTSAWRSLEALKASEAQVNALRERYGEVLGGRPEVDVWEIAALHRDHRSQRGSRVRVTWLKTEPANIDRVVDFFKTVSLPGLDGTYGFCSASLMIDRTTGTAVASATFDSQTAVETSRETARGLRERYVSESVGQILDVEEFELVLAHLHAPELV
jgi:quinol monooxygenase YgiN